MARLLVLDAGAAVWMTVDNVGKGAAVAEIVRGNSLVVPDLFFIECSNVLRKMVISKQHELTWDEAQSAVGRIRNLRAKVVSSRALLELVWDNDTVRRIDCYDGAYAAVARLIPAPIVTTDRKASFEASGVETVIRL